MKFTLSQTDRYWWPVTLRVPEPAKPGKIIEQSFQAEFEPLSPDEEVEAADRAAKLTKGKDVVRHAIDQAARVVKNWDGVVDGDGNPVPFTPEVLAQAMKKSWFRFGVQKALEESLRGEEARLGN